MSLYLLDYGKFEHFSYALDRKRIYRASIISGDNNFVSDNQTYSGLTSKDEEAEDCAEPINATEKSHTRKIKSSHRRMSVPQLSRNASVVKARDQRVASVVGIPHRHHITIAVNDEPVDIIKTTCTGPCPHDHSKLGRNHSSKFTRYQNNIFIESDTRSKHNSTNVIILTMIYVISTICVRSIITLYTTLYGTTLFQRKVTLSLLYFFSAISVVFFSLNPSLGCIASWSSRIRLITSISLVILWSGLHLIPSTPLYATVFLAAILAVALSLFWDCQMQLLVKWSPLSHTSTHVDLNNDVTIRSNIVPTTNVISHSMHIWANILMFIVLEAMSTTMTVNRKIIKPDVGKHYQTNASNAQKVENRSVCGIIDADFSTNQRWKRPDQIMFYLHYVCISLNIIAIILVILLFDKSRSIRIPSNSLDKDSHRPVMNSNANQNLSLLEPQNANESFPIRIGNRILTWTKNKSIIVMKIWAFQRIKYVLPSLFTAGLAEGFFITDYNERFISCFHKPSLIGVSMLVFALGVVILVNVFQMMRRYQTIEMIAFPASRIVFLVSSLILVLANVGHHWSFLLIFYPVVLASDAMICLAVYYVYVATLPGQLTDHSIAIQRILRLLGIGTYVLTSALAGPRVASVTIAIAHCFISPAIILFAKVFKDSKV